MRVNVAIIIFSLLAAGCAPPIKMLRESSTSIPSNPISVREAFRDAVSYRLGKEINISVSTSQVPLVNFGKGDLFVIPLIGDAKKSRIVKVKSYVTRNDDGSHLLFYPIISYVDQDFNVYQTIQPKYEFDFYENVLTNEFAVPAGVERLIIHTDKEFFGGSFEGITSGGMPPSGGVAATAGVLGGAIGALLLKAATESEKKPFRFGEVGVISVEVN